MKKNFLKSLALLMMFSFGFSSNVLAASPEETILKNNESVSEFKMLGNNINVESDFPLETFDYLTYEDMENIEIQIMNYTKKNPNASNYDLDNFAGDLMLQYADENIRSNSIRSSNSISRSSGSWLDPSPEERQYMKTHKREVASYSYCTSIAYKQANSRYTKNSLWYDGNGDAFRHLVWSSSLVKRFHDVLGYDLSDSMDASERWTNVHEPECDKNSLQSKMDVQNNITGRGLGSMYYKDDYSTIIRKSQYYIDNGYASRIKEVNGVDKLVPTDDTEKK